MNRFRNLPIRRKLTAIVMLTCSVLVLICAVFFLADKFISFRRNKVAGLATLAQVIGMNSTAALIFQDRRTAEEILCALSAESDVTAACIFKSDGSLFAVYPLGSEKAALAAKNFAASRQIARIVKDYAGQWNLHLFGGNWLDLARPIVLNGKRIGHIVICADMQQLNSRLIWSAVMVMLLMTLLVLLARAATARLHRAIADPISVLVDTMAAVTAQKNYALRAQKVSDDELGILIDGFNGMLSKIQKRDQQLDKHRLQLERQVGQRTRELSLSNEQLKREIKERHEVQERLDRAQRMEAVGMLASGVAHDLNNILSGLLSYPELLLMSLPEDSDLRAPLSTIRASGFKAAAIVQDLLTMARRGVNTHEVVNLGTIVTDYLASPEHAKIISDHPGVRVLTRFEPGVMQIAGSPVHLSKAVMNLVCNAAEAISGAGTISIGLCNHYIDSPVHGYDKVQPGDYVRLTISDTGHGIAQQDLQRIFEPFYTKKKMGRSGTGLGMAVVWGTVKDHQGYIDVTSTEGQGSCFDLYFPVTRLKRRFAEQVSAADFRGAGQTILVVDDIEEQREIASAILRQLGYQVHSVPGGEAAVEFLQSRTVDLLLLDMIMEPGIDGLETYRRIAARHPGQKAIIVSGYSESEHVREAQRLGAGTCLRKPYSIEKLAQVVDHELAAGQEAILLESVLD